LGCERSTEKLRQTLSLSRCLDSGVVAIGLLLVPKLLYLLNAAKDREIGED